MYPPDEIPLDGIAEDTSGEADNTVALPANDAVADNTVVPTLPEGAPIDDSTEQNAGDPFQEEIGKAFDDLLFSARDDDRFVREEYLRTWKRLEYYWNNILDIFLDPGSREWRVPDWGMLEESGEIAPRLINIYRPHGEAIVAALSVAVPSLIFHPDDADNPDDLDAAKAYRSITDLLAMHNDAPMLFIHALVIMFNQGTIFGYNYYHADPKFGSYHKPTIEYQDIALFEAFCPQCASPLDAGVAGKQEGVYQCQVCGYQGPAEIQATSERLPQITGFNKSPKGSVCQEIFSGLNVKVPAYAKNQEGCGYLLLEFTQSTAMLRSIFKERAREIRSKVDDYWETFSKLPLQYLGEAPDNASNVSCLWVRPWQFYDLNINNVELIEELVKRYPDGAYAIFINDTFMEAHPENMDEHWTISKNPLGNFIYARPLGENLSTVQDIRAQLVEIELQTAEFGIPETFADGKVLDFNKYGQGRAQPGMVTQAKPRAGKSLGDAFFTTKSAVLSQEIDPLRQHIDQDAQFVSGSFPSIYGGTSIGGSKTASEYTQSRAMALQRIGTVWKIASSFWAMFQSRSAVEYANVLKEMGKDERFTKQEGNGFVNVWIRSTSLTGRVGRVEPESSEQLPSSWAQKKETIQLLLQSGVEEILMTLMHPNNAPLMKEAVGLKEFYIPGEESRTRQHKEFIMMSQGIPVPINPIVDNHQVHIEVLRSILEGELGESLDEQIKQICMMHLQEHMMIAATQQQDAEEDPDSEKSEGNQKEKSDVPS